MCFCCMSTCTWVEVDRSECSYTFACVLNYGMGYFSEEHRMQLAAETECPCPVQSMGTLLATLTAAAVGRILSLLLT